MRCLSTAKECRKGTLGASSAGSTTLNGFSLPNESKSTRESMWEPATIQGIEDLLSFGVSKLSNATDDGLPVLCNNVSADAEAEMLVCKMCHWVTCKRASVASACANSVLQPSFSDRAAVPIIFTCDEARFIM